MQAEDDMAVYDYTTAGFDEFLTRGVENIESTTEDDTSAQITQLSGTSIASGVTTSQTGKMVARWNDEEFYVTDGARKRVSMGNIDSLGIYGLKVWDNSGEVRFEASSSALYSALAGRQVKVSATAGTGDFTDINDAIAYLGPLGGGTIVLGEGTITVTEQINVNYDNLKIVGIDRENSIVKMGSGANLEDLFYISKDNIYLGNFTIDGNKDNNTTGQILIQDYNNRCVYENLYIINGARSGSGYGGVGIYGGGDNTIVKDVYIKDCDGIAFQNASSDYAVYNNCFVENCGYGFDVGFYNRIVACTVNGTTIGSGYIGNYSGIQYIGCVAHDCATYGFNLGEANITIIGADVAGCSTGAIDVGAMERTKVIGCRIANSPGIGITMTGADWCVIEGNTFRLDDSNYSGTNVIVLSNCSMNVVSGNTIETSIGLAANNTYSGIILQDTSTRNIITNNTILGRTLLTNNLKYGIREDSANDDFNLIHANIVTDCETTNISTQGGSTVATDNISS